MGLLHQKTTVKIVAGLNALPRQKSAAVLTALLFWGSLDWLDVVRLLADGVRRRDLLADEEMIWQLCAVLDQAGRADVLASYAVFATSPTFFVRILRTLRWQSLSAPERSRIASAAARLATRFSPSELTALRPLARRCLHSRSREEQAQGVSLAGALHPLGASEVAAIVRLARVGDRAVRTNAWSALFQLRRSGHRFRNEAELLRLAKHAATHDREKHVRHNARWFIKGLRGQATLARGDHRPSRASAAAA